MTWLNGSRAGGTAVKWLLWLLFPMLLHAHAVSLSSGEARLDGRSLHLEVRLPLYEAEHVRQPELVIPEQFAVSIDGVAAERREQSCHPDSRAGQLVCQASYLLPRETDTVDVRCDLPKVLVANHVHLLRMTDGHRTAQAMFDQNFPAGRLSLREPSAAALAAGSMLAGLAGLAQPPLLLLLPFGLAAAARGWRELAGHAVLWLGAAAMFFLRPVSPVWRLSPYFLEAAMGLTVAYLAAESLLFPKERWRWPAALVGGAALGVYLRLEYAASGHAMAWLLAGFATGAAGLLALFYLLTIRLRRWPAATAAPLFALGGGWFLRRLFGA